MDIDKIAMQNPWWEDKEAIHKDDKVKAVLDTKEKIRFDLGSENTVLVGPRQLGKTTALKYDIYRKIKAGVDQHTLLYYSFDTSRDFEEILDVLNTFATGDAKKFAYLDEVSFVDGWQRAVKQFLDSGNATNVTIYVTGSSSISLRKELMPGRKIRFAEFKPLSFRRFALSFGSHSLAELLNRTIAKSIKEVVDYSGRLMPYLSEIGKLFDTYITTGGYPDAIFEYMNNGYITSNLFDAHWNAFVSDVSKANKSVEIATMIIYGILESYASKITLSAIARAQGIKSHITVREYIEAFEDLFVAKSVFPLAGKRYVFRKERKVYFNDPFLYNVFAKKMNFADKERVPKVVEGIVYNHLYNFVNRERGIAEPKTEIGFYSGKKEVDFVINDFGFEVKWQNEVSEYDFPKIEIKNKIILSKKTAGKFKNGVAAIPLPFLLALLDYNTL